jgi:hypothetical protein
VLGCWQGTEDKGAVIGIDIGKDSGFKPQFFGARSQISIVDGDWPAPHKFIFTRPSDLLPGANAGPFFVRIAE